MNIELIDIAEPTVKIKLGKESIELTDAQAKELQNKLNAKYTDNTPYRYYYYPQQLTSLQQQLQPFTSRLGDITCQS